MHIAPLKERVSAQEWQLQIDPQIMKGMGAVMRRPRPQGKVPSWPGPRCCANSTARIRDSGPAIHHRRNSQRHPVQLLKQAPTCRTGL